MDAENKSIFAFIVLLCTTLIITQDIVLSLIIAPLVTLPVVKILFEQE